MGELTIDRGVVLRLTAALVLSSLVHLSLVVGVRVVPRDGDSAISVLRAQLHALEDSGPPSTSEPSTTTRPEGRARAPRPKPERLAPRPESQVPSAVATSAGERPVEPVSTLPPVEMPLLTDTNWYAARDLDNYPRPLTPVRPEYPEHAELAQREGVVTLLVSIDENGSVQDVSVVDAAPAGVFEEAAVAALQAARFAPARRDGRDVRSRLSMKLTFVPGASGR